MGQLSPISIKPPYGSGLNMRLYCNGTIILNEEFALPETAAHHARVVRAQVGDLLDLFNGDGYAYLAQISRMERKHVFVLVQNKEQQHRESPFPIHLAVVLSKGDRLDWSLQKATELGIHRISLLTSSRCEVHLRGEDRLDRKMQHWQQVIISACEQSGRCCIPQLTQPAPLQDFLQRVDDTNDRIFLEPSAHTGITQLQVAPGQGITLLVGPEGGWSDEERSQMVHSGCQATRLGPRILRTETAPLAAIAVLQGLYGDLH